MGIDGDGNRPERPTYRLTGAGDAASSDGSGSQLGRIDGPAEFRAAPAETHDLERDDVTAGRGRRRELLAGRDRRKPDGPGGCGPGG